MATVMDGAVRRRRSTTWKKSSCERRSENSSRRVWRAPETQRQYSRSNDRAKRSGATILVPAAAGKSTRSAAERENSRQSSVVSHREKRARASSTAFVVLGRVRTQPGTSVPGHMQDNAASPAGTAEARGSGCVVPEGTRMPCCDKNPALTCRAGFLFRGFLCSALRVSPDAPRPFEEVFQRHEVQDPVWLDSRFQCRGCGINDESQLRGPVGVSAERDPAAGFFR